MCGRTQWTAREESGERFRTCPRAQLMKTLRRALNAEIASVRRRNCHVTWQFVLMAVFARVQRCLIDVICLLRARKSAT